MIGVTTVTALDCPVAGAHPLVHIWLCRLWRGHIRAVSALVFRFGWLFVAHRVPSDALWGVRIVAGAR